MYRAAATLEVAATMTWKWGACHRQEEALGFPLEQTARQSLALPGMVVRAVEVETTQRCVLP
jgi:hypothetical protein